MRRAAWAAVALLALATPAVAKKPVPPAPEAPPPEGVHLEQLDGGTRLDAVLPGWLRGYTLPRRADGSRDVMLLVGVVWPAVVRSQEETRPAGTPCDEPEPTEAARAAPCRLLRLDLSGPGEIEVVRDDLPADSWGLDSFDVDGDGTEELLLFVNGEIRLLRDVGGKRFGGRPESLVVDPALGYGEREPRIVRSPAAGGKLLPVATEDGLRAYGRRADGRFGLVSSTPLPLAVQRDRDSIRVETPTVTEIGSIGDGALELAASGDGDGEKIANIRMVRADRLRTVLLVPSAEPSLRLIECWSKLPAREWLHDREYRMLDGRPAMIVTTTPADKIKLLGKKLLRLFVLEADRTKAGKLPLLAVETDAHLWRRVAPFFLDVNEDGRTDLVVGFQKGLNSGPMTLEAFLRMEDGSFDPSPRETTIDVKDADDTVIEYGRDVDGDGAVDLLLVDSGRILVFPGGKAATGGKEIVASTPRYSLPLPSFAASVGPVATRVGLDGPTISTRRGRIGIPRPVDIDGDGRLEILVEAGLKDGRSAVVIFRIAPSRTSGS